MIVVGPIEELASLEKRLQDILDGSARLAHAATFDTAALFRADGLGADRPAAWVIIGHARVSIRVAGPGRQRFVFRDIGVARPLTEIDRERVGQSLKAALVTVIDGGPATLDRLGAQQAAGVATPAPSAPVVAAPAPPASASAPGPGSADASAQDPPNLRLAGFLQRSSFINDSIFSVGVLGSATVRYAMLRGGVWLSLITYLPHGIPSGNDIVAYGSGLRAGINLAVTDLSWIQLDLGIGPDWSRPSYFGGGPKFVMVYRTNVRVGPAETWPLKPALVLFYEYTPNTLVNVSVEPVSNNRAGLALELWWR